MIQRKYNLNLCLAIGLGAILLTLALGALQKQAGIFDGADAAAIQAAKAVRSVPLLTLVMKFITFLGDEMGITIVLCVLYWLGFSTEAATFLLILLFGSTINGQHPCPASALTSETMCFTMAIRAFPQRFHAWMSGVVPARGKSHNRIL